MKYVGYHPDHKLPIKQGDTVIIRKGTVIRHRGKDVVAGKTFKVKVHHILPGMSETIHGEYEEDPAGGLRNKLRPVTNPKVRWPGPGGYWSEVDINDVLPEET